jgi:2-oxo-4-hydroxy-4-carboxy-5-ureidoimidazoline decarboxylase
MGSDSVEHIKEGKVVALCNQGQEIFVRELGGIYEHSPWIAERAWKQQPFATVEELHAALVNVVSDASASEQLALICAHPELAGKEADEGSLTAASTNEQRGAGLNQCSREELARLRRLNAEYRSKFGFPFVIAVKGLSRYQIMDAIESRMANTRDSEFQACLDQIFKIAKFRLEAFFE